MDKPTERRGVSPGTEAVNYKSQSHLSLQPTTHAKVGSRRAMLSKQNPEVLSPLVLSPHEDIECSGFPFVLEEPLHKEGQSCNKGAEAKANWQHSGAKTSVGRSRTCLTGIGKEWKSCNQLISSSSTSKRTSQGSFLGTWEFSSSDELDIFDSLRNVHSLPCSSSERQNRRKVSAGSAKRSFKVQKDSADCSQNDLPVLNANGLQSSLPITCMSWTIDDEISSAGKSMKASCSEVANSFKEAGIVTEPSLSVQHPITSGMELTVVTEQPPRSLSQKYRPRLFEELVGQELVVQALSSAILKGRIAPVYLFHGSRGTGKTSTARILAAALNCCMAYAERRPCTFCSQCKALALGKSLAVWEVDAASHRDANDVYVLVQTMLASPSNSRYKVFIIDECHMLTDETWNALLNFLEEPPGDLVFILVTTYLDGLPRTASSRCQKFSFMKVKHSEIMKRLNKLATLEGLDVEHGALDLIASRSEGSLRDAEMTLDQLSLSGQTITSSAVLDLVGPVSDERLLYLLDLALGSDTVRTVQKAKELVDSGVDPSDLMTRLARLITDLLAGSRKIVTQNHDQLVFRRMCSKEGLEGMRAALKMLLEAEKQVKAVHHDRFAWLTAALLQLGYYQQPKFLLSSRTSATSSPILQKGSGNMKGYEQKGRQLTKWANTRHSLNKTSPYSEHANWASTFKPKGRLGKSNLEARIHPTVCSFPEDINPGDLVDSSEAGSSPFSSKDSERRTSFFGPGNLGNLWLNILKGCKSLPLRHLLSHGKLLAVCFSTVEAMVHLEFKDPEQKSRAERYRKVIANICKKGMGLSVNVKISLACQPSGKDILASPLPLLAKHTQDCLEESEDAVRSEHEVLVKLSKNEVASLPDGQGQSGQNRMQHDYPAFRMASYHMPESSLAIQTEDKVPASEDCLDVSRSGLIFRERGGMTWAGRVNELTASMDGYWQQSLGPQEHKNTLRNSTKDDSLAAPALKATDGEHGQRPWPPDGSALSGYEDGKVFEVLSHEQESLRCGELPKYERFLCCRGLSEEEKPLKRSRRRKCRALITFIPCGNTKS